MSNETITIEVSIGDEFSVQSKIGGRVSPPADGPDASQITPMQHFYISFGSCIAAVAQAVAVQSGMSDCSLNLTIAGDLGDLEPESVEIAVNMEADMPFEEKLSFLEEVDANLRSISHLTKNKLEK